MRISVNGRFQGQRVTGVQRYARELLARIGSRVTVVAPRVPLRGMRGHAWEQGVLPRMFKGNLLWSPCNTGPLTVRQQIVTIHDCGFYDHPECYSPLFVRWYRWLIPRLARRARHVITVSEFSRQRLIELVGLRENQVTVIPNGVSKRFQPAPPNVVAEVKRRRGLPARYILSLGTLEPRKNLARLLEAWRRLAPEVPDVSLVVVGAASSVFRSVHLADKLPRTVLAGHIPDEDLPAIYSGAEVFVYPSLYEGFGLPVLEAMACGVPVVCSHAPALQEVSSDAGILVDPYEPDSIAHGIGRLLEAPSLQTVLRRRGLERASHYTWRRAAENTWRLLQAVAEN
jgi:glycosyltransferase involved in cell wall biosynthesis